MTEEPTQGYSHVRLTPLNHQPGDGEPARHNLSLMRDIRLTVTVELGRTSLPLREVMKLVEGSVIELDQLAGEPVHLYASGRQVAEGEIVVLGANFGVRLTRILGTDLTGMAS
ncbi:MAG: flagellar motor switch protein FliN [Candidatus Sericytochromatia bacterium]|nr:flagellar motor switch protein FliN [Candidatus Sericytochromatia bacterium]